MNVKRLVLDTLRPTGVPVYPMTYTGTAEDYIIYTEYNQVSEMNADDIEWETEHFFQVDVFSSTGRYVNLSEDVYNRMKAAGFGRMFESETYDDEARKYRKIFRFSYYVNNEEAI